MHFFFFAIHTATGQVECYATKFLGPTNTRRAKFRYWKINAGLEKVGEVKSVSWSYESRDQKEELQRVLGEAWQVLPFHKVCSILSSSIQPAT